MRYTYNFRSGSGKLKYDFSIRNATSQTLRFFSTTAVKVWWGCRELGKIINGLISQYITSFKHKYISLNRRWEFFLAFGLDLFVPIVGSIFYIFVFRKNNFNKYQYQRLQELSKKTIVLTEKGVFYE